MIRTPNYVRGVLRSVLLIVSLLEARLRFLAIYVRSAGRVSTRQRCEWLHASCARILKRLSIPLTVAGSRPTRGVLVSNHLSYLDVLLYGATGEYLFVAKSEVRRWPLFGGLAQSGGTVFVERGRGLQSAEAAGQIEEVLSESVPVALFPEGTSSDGSDVLPFRSSLFDPAVRANACVTPAAICYESSELPESEIAYWGKMVFVPHLFRVLCLRDLSAEIRFGEPLVFADRKTAATITWKAVTQLRAGHVHEEGLRNADERYQNTVTAG